MKSATKKCGRCFERKPVSSFFRRKKGSDARVSYCRTCVREYGRAHYEQNKALYVKRARRYDEQRAKFFNELKGGPCSDCGLKFPPCVMEFDHREGKIENVSKMVFANRLSRSTVLAEIQKCDLVCANCHRLRTCKKQHRRHMLSQL